MPAVAIITPADITKRASARKGDDAGAGEEEAAPDPGKAKRMAAEDLVSALGLKPEDVDMEEVTSALSDFHEACYAEEESAETPKEEKTESDA